MKKKSKQTTDNPFLVKNGAVLDMTIEDVAPNGHGVARLNDISVFVSDTATGDQVTVRIDHRSKHTDHAWGRVFEVIQRGTAWKKHFCQEAIQQHGRCGGCPLGHVSRDVYREIKLRYVADALNAARLAQPALSLHIESPKHYRNKSNFVVHYSPKNGIQLGSFAPRTHHFASMDRCQINTKIISTAQRIVTEVLNEAGTTIYPKPDGVRYVTIKSFESGAVLVDIVVHSDSADQFVDLANGLLAQKFIQGVSITCNPIDGNQIRTQAPAYHCGKNTLTETIGDVSLRMRASTFFQLNNDVARTMYHQAAMWCADAKSIWDLYCGIGGLGLTASKHANARLFGCDEVTSSIDLARRNAEDNQVNGTFAVTDLSTAFPTQWPTADVVLVNPPRKGIDTHTLERLCQLQPKQIIYVSCNPTTFASDGRLLCDAGYTLHNTQAYDMLPYTSHVELLGRFMKH
ncbi:MAG: 23S rRNA (uracil(1939)-C(5))-methyltransferase RlmD [Deltaproteobacteria bacterium]|nr:23S rRNA (uracil(1939)-C(5))-methyltransferase RlmD [Deltaproteobacteria bacterium]MBN2673868.1 23S rRNA (uracil(1939)-C(5))-methyltransferase RlmD [Deltaproteobacteria bacterium]